MSSERDELAGIIHVAMPLHHPVHADTQDIADAILAAGYRKPRQVTTVEELDALPVGSVILDRDGMALQRTMWLGWVASNGSTNIDREELERDCFPATVLHIGATDD